MRAVTWLRRGSASSRAPAFPISYATFGSKPCEARMCLAIPGKIVELLPERDNLALVEVAGVRRKIDVGLLNDGSTAVGDWVLIHVGFAMCKISEADALEQMRVLTLLGE